MAAKRKKKKLGDIKQAHGKTEAKFVPTTLDQIWGDDGTSLYGTNNLETYQSRIFDMNMSDLQAHASRVGIIPVDNRNMLTDRLLREFSQHTSAYRKPAVAEGEKVIISDKVKKILAEGR
jgi:hypothetical protein